METLSTVRQNGQARQMTAPELREIIAGAGVTIEYRNGRIVTHEPGERARRWPPTFNSNARELATLHSIALAYNIAVA